MNVYNIFCLDNKHIHKVDKYLNFWGQLPIQIISSFSLWISNEIYSIMQSCFKVFRDVNGKVNGRDLGKAKIFRFTFSTIVYSLFFLQSYAAGHNPHASHSPEKALDGRS